MVALLDMAAWTHALDARTPGALGAATLHLFPADFQAQVAWWVDPGLPPQGAPMPPTAWMDRLQDPDDLRNEATQDDRGRRSVLDSGLWIPGEARQGGLLRLPGPVAPSCCWGAGWPPWSRCAPG